MHMAARSFPLVKVNSREGLNCEYQLSQCLAPKGNLGELVLTVFPPSTKEREKIPQASREKKTG